MVPPCPPPRARSSGGRSLLFAISLVVGACGVSEIPHGSPGAGGASGVDAPPASGGAPGSGGNGGSGGRVGGNGGSAGRGGAGGRGGSSGTTGGAGGARDAGPDRAPAPEVAPPAEGLVIGGVARPRDKVVVFIHLGHSNMAGRTNTPVEARPYHFETDPRLWTLTEATNAWVPAREPLSGDYLTRGRAGPGMSILRAALALAPADAVMVSVGRGQDGSRGGECKAFRRGGLLYDTVMARARQLRGKVVFGGIFSMLVLMDIFDKPTLARAHECHEGVARDMREDLGDPNIPFVMSDWEMGATGRFDPDLPDAVTARAQLRVAQQNIPRSVIVPTDGLPMSDDHHFDLNGYKTWGERALQLMQQNGWLTWADPAN